MPPHPGGTGHRRSRADGPVAPDGVVVVFVVAAVAAAADVALSLYSAILLPSHPYWRSA